MTPNSSPPPVSIKSPDATNNRRSFFAAAAAILAGSVAVLTPIGVGIASFLTPLFRKSQSSQVRVALLDQVPDDGRPRYFPVVAEREDAWTRYPAQRIGAVYLVRKAGEAKPTAFTAKCPHAGCFIGYTPGEDLFKCPCHTSSFQLDGTRARGDAEVAPRDMDTLPVEIRLAQVGHAADGIGLRRRLRRGRGAPPRDDGSSEVAAVKEVWVEFIDYQTGHKERVPTT
jgi:menaquinol-cytochrome c reductase iron-sulfur subunit